MTKRDIIRIFQGYVENDYEASGSLDYIKDALLTVATEEEIRYLGFGWVLDEDSEND
jgi:hypothetical protein